MVKPVRKRRHELAPVSSHGLHRPALAGSDGVVHRSFTPFRTWARKASIDGEKIMKIRTMPGVLVFLGIQTIAFGFVGEQWGAWEPFYPSVGSEPVIMVRYRLERFGSMGKEWEWQFRNVGATRTAFRWRVQFSDAKAMTLDATLGPGEIGSGWTCDVERRCSGQPKPTFAGLIGTLHQADATGSVRKPGGLVFESCDADPEDLEHKCNVAKLQCNKNADEWCRLQRAKPFQTCMNEFLARCGTRREQCIQKIRACPAGKRCTQGSCK